MVCQPDFRIHFGIAGIARSLPIPITTAAKLSRARITAGPGRQPGVLMPPPSKPWHQPVLHIVARIAHSETPPNQTGNALGGPDRRVESMGCRPLLQQAGESRQFFTSQLRTGPSGFWAAAQSLLASQTMPGGPSLHRLSADAQGAGNFSHRFAAFQAGDGRKASRLQFFCVALRISQLPWHVPGPPGRKESSSTSFMMKVQFACPLNPGGTAR